MGIVYRAMDPVLNRVVAIKVMSEGLAQDEALRERFLREAQAAGSLQHPNVVTVYDFGETEGHLYIAMEFIRGADLEQLLKQNAPLTLAYKLDIIIDVLNGLSYAHRRGIVHRDIKPANIRLDEEGHARIMDFGVARLATSNLTKSGVMMGTPNYMAPEQITGEDPSPAVDLFSAGAVLYELLTHVRPFSGDTMHSVLFKIVSESPRDPLEIKPELPPQLGEVVQRALAKDPRDRFHSASEMANAISAVRATLGPARISKTLAQRVSARDTIDKALKAKTDESERSARRWRAVGTGAVALLAVVTVASLAFRRRPEPSPAAPAPSVPVAAAMARADSARPRPVAAADTAPVSTAPPAIAERPQTAAPVNPPATRDAARRTALGTASPQGRPSGARAGETAVPRSRVEETTRVVSTPPVSTPATQGTTTAPTSAVSAPAPTPPAPVEVRQDTAVRAPAPQPENPRPAIASVVSAYARAIGTRDVREVRRVYVGMTPQQQAAWDSFFSSIRSMNASFEIASLDVTGSTAVAKLTGVYEYVARNGRMERQPVSIDATLQKEGERWTLQIVR